MTWMVSPGSQDIRKSWPSHRYAVLYLVPSGASPEKIKDKWINIWCFKKERKKKNIKNKKQCTVSKEENKNSLHIIGGLIRLLSVNWHH